MSVRLVILGLLRERPLYGYEIKKLIQERMGDWTAIAFGSIYFALAKLTAEGFIEKIAEEQEGRRPSRSVYQITEPGQKEFRRLLRQVWGGMERQYFTFDLGLFFMEALPAPEAREHLARRITALEKALAKLDRHRLQTMTHPQTPPLAEAIFEHTQVHLRAELDWLQGLQAKVVAGEYP